MNPNGSDEILKILDVGSGRSVAAAFFHTPENICVVIVVAPKATACCVFSGNFNCVSPDCSQ